MKPKFFDDPEDVGIHWIFCLKVFNPNAKKTSLFSKFFIKISFYAHGINHNSSSLRIGVKFIRYILSPAKSICNKVSFADGVNLFVTRRIFLLLDVFPRRISVERRSPRFYSQEK